MGAIVLSPLLDWHTFNKCLENAPRYNVSDLVFLLLILKVLAFARLCVRLEIDFRPHYEYPKSGHM
jgi:hypothetical protein